MGWVSLQNAKLDSLAAASLSFDLNTSSTSVTLFVNPADIFVAQIALTSLAALGGDVVVAYISGITLQNGVVIDFPDMPNVIEYAWTASVTFVLTRLGVSDASALATVSTYML